jgi:hypothetical protein
MSDTTSQTQAPAYVAWGTFRNFLNSLRENGLPTQINRSVMSKLSFSAQAQLTTALKSLGLTDAKGAPTPILAELIAADEAGQREVIKKILHRSYGFVFNTLDLSRATPGELETQFKAAGISGSTVGRAVAFFLSAATFAGIALSAHIKKNGASSSTRSPSGARKRRVSVPPKTPGADPSGKTILTEGGFEQGLLSKFPEFNPSWPEDIQKSWFDGFKTLMGMAPQKKSEPE